MLRRLLFRNFRFVYRLSQWTRHRLTPTGSLILATMVAAGIFGIDIRQSLAFQIFTISAFLLLLSLLSVFTFRSNFRIRRQLPDFCTVGSPLKYKIQLHNLDNHRQQELLLIDELQTTLPDFAEFSNSDDPQDRHRNWFDRVVGYPRLMSLIQRKRGAAILPIEVDDMPAAEQIEFNVNLLPLRRGYLHFSKSSIARADPFGLFRAILSTTNKDSLLVLPKTYRLPAIQLPGHRKYQQGGMNQASTVGDSQEFMSLRDYQPGDPLRAIHWRSYAKTGVPLVKEFQDEFFVRQGLILDTFIEDKSSYAFEEAVSVAASFTISSKQQDALLDLMFIGTQAYCFTTGRGLGKAENMLEVLACIEPCREPSFDKLNELILQHATEMSGLICIFLDWDKKRRDLVRRLTENNIPVLVLLVTENTNATVWDRTPLGNHPQHFKVLQTGNMQEALEQLNTLDDAS